VLTSAQPAAPGNRFSGCRPGRLSGETSSGPEPVGSTGDRGCLASTLGWHRAVPTTGSLSRSRGARPVVVLAVVPARAALERHVIAAGFEDGPETSSPVNSGVAMPRMLTRKSTTTKSQTACGDGQVVTWRDKTTDGPRRASEAGRSVTGDQIGCSEMEAVVVVRSARGPTPCGLRLPPMPCQTTTTTCRLP
jgi:hypothetical protein